jgi:predicted ATPase/DNA-binding XRE family transcriptional regulator
MRFGELLRSHRLSAGFSQERLAERANISANAISALERGDRKAPYPHTARLIAEALGLSGAERDEFDAVVAGSRRRGPKTKHEGNKGQHNLPWIATTCIGRDEEIADLVQLFTRFRCVTITGSGGIGKTRVAYEVGARMLTEFGDGVRFVDLASITEPEVVVSKVAAATGVSPADDGDATTSLSRALVGRRLFVILDNCEHLLTAAAAAALAILQADPQNIVLATSRERLAIAGEAVHRLPTLAFPQRGERMAIADLATYPAVQLFVERAVAADARFETTPESLEVIAEICRQIDGIALAIELAVARLPALGLLSLRDRLSQQLSVLSRGHRDAPKRQQTLRGTIRWSYDLLDEHEQLLLRRLSVFAGIWTLDAAKIVCPGEGLSEEALFDSLCSLVDKSLVVADNDGPVMHYRLLESTRAFAFEQLVESGANLAGSRRHAEWIADIADRRNEMGLRIPKRALGDILPHDLDNIRAALEWSLGPAGDPVIGGRIVAGHCPVWLSLSLVSELRYWIDSVLDRLDPARDPGVVALVLVARIRCTVGRVLIAAADEAIPLLEQIGDKRFLAFVYSQASSLGYAMTGRFEDAERVSDKAAVLCEEAGMQGSYLKLMQLTDRTFAFVYAGQYEKARAAMNEARPIATILRDEWTLTFLQSLQIELEVADGHEEVARRLAEVHAARTQREGAMRGTTRALCKLACLRLILGDIDDAEDAALNALDLRGNEHGFTPLFSVQALAAAAALRELPLPAARLLGYVEATRRREDIQRFPTEQRVFDLAMGALRDQLSEDALDAAMSEGALLGEEQAQEEALALA